MLLAAENKISEVTLREIKKSCCAYCIEVFTQIKNRIDFNDKTLNVVQIIHPNNVCDTLIPLIEIFSNLIPNNNSADLEGEWRELLECDFQKYCSKFALNQEIYLEGFWE